MIALGTNILVRFLVKDDDMQPKIVFIQFEKLEVIHELIKNGKSTSIELSDLLICNSSKASGCERTIAFDKDASKHHLFKLLS